MWDESTQRGELMSAGSGLPSRSRPFAARSVRLNDERGATLVEFALVLIIFMTILFGIVGFGHALYAYHFVSHAAREAARYAAVRGSTCGNDGSCATTNSASGTAGPTTSADLQTYVTSIAPPGINPTNVTVTACGVAGGTMCSASSSADICNPASTFYIALNHPNCTVQVQVQYTFNFILPLISTSGLTMTSSSDLIIVH
jgi:Flp pilus assembly protein TadG